ncbi:MEDS domain-containing protein [Blastococcus sp. SYSU D00820]
MPAVPDPSPSTAPAGHRWVLLAGEEAHADLVGDFVADGLRAGDCVLVAGLGHREERLRGRLDAAGVDHEAALRALPADPAALPGAVDDALADGFPGVRVTGAIDAPGPSPFEPVVADLVHRRPVSVLCPYFTRLLSAEQQEALAAEHDDLVADPAEYDDGTFRLTRDAGALRLAGRLDAGNTEAQRAVLRAALGPGGGLLPWDLADLQAVDADAAAALITAAAGPEELTLLHPGRDTAELLRALAGSLGGHPLTIRGG